jgi:hypothetical protein
MVILAGAEPGWRGRELAGRRRGRGRGRGYAPRSTSAATRARARLRSEETRTRRMRFGSEGSWMPTALPWASRRSSYWSAESIQAYQSSALRPARTWDSAVRAVAGQEQAGSLHGRPAGCRGDDAARPVGGVGAVEHRARLLRIHQAWRVESRFWRVPDAHVLRAEQQVEPPLQRPFADLAQAVLEGTGALDRVEPAEDRQAVVLERDVRDHQAATGGTVRARRGDRRGAHWESPPASSQEGRSSSTRKV